MSNASRDQNFVPTLLGVSSADGVTPITIYADPVTHRLLVDFSGAGSGNVTGPLSSTDSAIALFDGTTGEIIKNSAVTIDVNGAITVAGNYTLPYTDGTTGQTLQTDGAGTVTWSSAGSGDVTGPASSTDNAIARFNLTTGKVIQNSGVTIGDNNDTVITIANTANVKGLTVYQNDTTNYPLAAQFGPDAAQVTSSTLVQLNDSTGGNLSDFSLRASANGTPYINIMSTGGTLSAPTASSLGIKSEIDTIAYNSTPAAKVISSIFTTLSTGTAGSEDAYIGFQTILSGILGTRLAIGSSINGISLGDALNPGVISSNGSQNLVLQTGNPTTGTITIANGANGNITLAPNGTGKVTTNNNLFANNLLANATSTVSAGGTTILTVASSRYQALTGSSNQTYQLPDATTLSVGPWFNFNNNSSGSLIITNAGGSTIYTVPAGGIAQVGPTSIATSNGTWDVHEFIPSTVTWGTGASGLIFNTALSTTPQIMAGASSVTAPSFIPQRTASTTGFGGDGTNLFATIGGTAYLKVASGSISPNANDATALGTTALSFSDLFLASGGVINWNNGDYTLTHSTGILTANKDLRVTTVGTNSASVVTVGGTQTLTGKSIVASQITTGTFGTGAYTMDTRLTVPQILNTPATITVTTNAGTVTRANRINNFTNSSAATMTITMSTTGATDGDMVMVVILDASAVAQTITWVNTEDSTVTAPTTSNGSTTLPLTVGFKWNAGTSKWRTIAKS